MGRRSSPGYNCAHFACEVWAAETGQDITATLRGVLFPPRERCLRLRDVREVTVLDKPVSPCLVLMRNQWSTHVGVWLRGKVLHLLEDGGVQYMPLKVATIGFPKVRFFRC